MLHPLIQPYLPRIVNLLKAHKITQAAIFGSGVTDRFNEASDIDLIVTIKEGLDPAEAGEHLWDLTYELEDLLHRKIDLITERSLKNPYFIEEIKKTKLIIYESWNKEIAPRCAYVHWKYWFAYNAEVITKTTIHSTIPGVKTIEYKIPALDAKLLTTGALKGDGATPFVKTLYDPAIWSDAKLEKALKEALQDAANKNNGVILEKFIGNSTEGYSIEGYYRNGTVDTFYFK